MDKEVAIGPDQAIDPGLLERLRVGASRLRSESAGARIMRIRRLRAAMVAARPALYEAFQADLGKGPEAVDLSEIFPVALEMDHAIKNLRRWMRPRRAGAPLAFLGTRSEIQVVGKGATLIIAPWNYPVTLTLGPLVSAIAAGCSAAIKPSEYTPEVGRVVRDIVSSCFAEDEALVIQGGGETAKALVALPFAHIYFTGSPRVGKLVMQAASEHLTPVTLELGGKSPAVVDQTVDIPQTARRIAFGKFSNAGQTCIAPDYVYVHQSVHEQLVASLNEAVAAFYDDAQHSSDYSRIVSSRHHARLAEMCIDAADRGASVSGGFSDEHGHYLAPTVLSDVPADARVLDEEIFGPLLPVVPYSDLDEVVDGINRLAPPLAMYVFSRSKKAIEHLLATTQSGGVVVNDSLLQFANPHLPFGGVGASGIGRGHGRWGFMEFSNERPVLRQGRRWALTSLFHPPTTGMKRRLLDVILRMYRV